MKSSPAATVGVIVIGQSPRMKAEAELRRVLGPEVGIDLRGALDGLSRAEIDKIKPADGHDTLFTELPSGEGVVISKQVVTERTQAHIDDFAARGVDTTLMFCTGKFKGLRANGPVVFPSAVLSGIVGGLMPEGRLGVFVPLPEQAAELGAKWERNGVAVHIEPLLPIAESAAAHAAADRMAAWGPDLVVMDCMGYSSAMKDVVRSAVGPRVVLAVSAAARSVQELLT